MQLNKSVGIQSWAFLGTKAIDWTKDGLATLRVPEAPWGPRKRQKGGIKIREIKPWLDRSGSQAKAGTVSRQVGHFPFPVTKFLGPVLTMCKPVAGEKRFIFKPSLFWQHKAIVDLSYPILFLFYFLHESSQ